MADGLTPASTSHTQPQPQPELQKLVFGVGHVARMLEHVSDQGHGNADYWVRTYEDNARMVRAQAGLLERLAAREGQPAVRVLLEDCVRQLRTATPTGDMTGTLDDWRGWSADVRETAHKVGGELRRITPLASTGLDAKGALQELTGLSSALSSRGLGYSDYWVRACADAERLAGPIATEIKDVAKTLPGTTGTVVQQLAVQMAGVQGSGRGDADYWSAQTAMVVRRVVELASSVRRIADAL